jgi:hypothetical protein
VSAAAKLAAASLAVARAREAVAMGAFVDLAGLDGLVAAACEEARGAARLDRDAAARALGVLIDDLDRLTTALAEQQRAVETDDAASRQRALRAYGAKGGE